MHNHPSNIPKPQRRFEVDMSSAAIASRIREVGELYELGVSLAKAKPCPNPNQALDKFIAEDSSGNPRANKDK